MTDRLGLRNRLVDDADRETAVAELAETLAAQPPLAARGAEAAVNLVAGGARGEEVLRP